MAYGRTGLESAYCSECGKMFIPAPCHMYKRSKLINGNKVVVKQCSYNCYRTAGGDNGKPRRETRSKEALR